MISKAKLKELAAYKQAKTCEREEVFVVEGPKMCDEALRAGLRPLAVCATEDWLRGRNVVCDACHEVGEAELERLSSMRAPNQVWMLLSRHFEPLCAPQDDDATLVLDRIQDPGNLGTIIRTADWFGVRRVVCSPDTVSCFNPKVVQATMGAIFRTRVEYRPLLPLLTHHPGPVYGALLDGESLYSTPLQRAGALIIVGNEGRGISPELQGCISHRVLIPNRGGTCESLNASVAAAILLAEFYRP